MALGTLGRFVCAILWSDEVSRTDNCSRIGIKTAMIGQKDKLGRTQLTGTMSQELGSIFSVTWWEAFQWKPKNEDNHYHIDCYSSLESTGPWHIRLQACFS
jgi:hypothetical protein